MIDALMTDEPSSIFEATVRTAGGRVVMTDGDRDEVDFWLAEFRTAETLDAVVVRELTLAEVNGGSRGASYNSPGA
jgi:hypothetical protein